MFDFVRQHNRIFQGALLLLIVPSFVAFGVQGYQRFADGEGDLAKVGGRSITKAEFDAALRSQIDRVQQQMPGVDTKKLDTPELRQRVLDDLVRQHVLFQAANDFHLAPSDARLDRLFKSEPQFAALRNEDGSLRKEMLQARGMSPAQFEAQLRQDIALQQVMMGVSGTSIGPASVATLAADAFFQRREIQIQRFDPRDQRSAGAVTDADARAFYDAPANKSRWMAAESADVEYVLLDLESIAKGIAVSDADLRKYYDENKSRYAAPEERRARHLLVKVDAKASAEDKAKARAKAESLLADVRKHPESFADVARKNSDDPGSAAQGGDLDWMARGAMVKPFEDAVFALKKGEISAVVETEFGYHVIALSDVRGGQAKDFDAVRGDILIEVRKQLAQQRFVEAAEQFSNGVEQEDTLKPVAERLKLEVKRVERLGRAPDASATGITASPKFLEAVFASQNLNSKRNSEAIDVGNQQLLAVHVQAYRPAVRRPLAEVLDQVREAVAQDRAVAAARKAGEAALATAQSGGAAAGVWGEAVTVSRQKVPESVSKTVAEAALRAPTVKLPLWIGVDLGGQGYAVVRINKVLGADPELMKDAARLQSQYANLWTAVEEQAYDKALQARFKVSTKAGSAVLGSASTPERN